VEGPDEFYYVGDKKADGKDEKEIKGIQCTV
jgi:hypothetical protein